jgi:transcriptional regulator with XRE-family HTH domain
MMFLSRKPGDAVPPEFVRDYRTSRGLTQDELALRLGVAGKAVVSGWETGRTKCEGVAAEFLLHLSGRGNAAIEIPAFTRSVDDIWQRAGDSITSWRQVVAVPEGALDIAPARFVTLFPDAALPPEQVRHGYPFTGEGLQSNVCGVGPSGWIGCIPAESNHQPAYLWTFKRDGKFAYREKLWEEHPSARTGGHFDVGTIALVSIQTTYFLQRAASLLKLDDSLGYTLQLDLRGSKGKGVADGNEFSGVFNQPTNRWAEDRADTCITTTVAELNADPLDVGLRLASELTMQVSVQLAQPKLLKQILKARLSTSKELGFLKASDL